MPALLFLGLTSCSLVRWKKPQRLEGMNAKGYSTSEYLAHQDYLLNSFLESNEAQLIKLSVSQKNYLANLYSFIRKKNELFFTSKSEPVFYMIKSNEPFHFSLPDNHFFFSSSLLSKYIKNESLLNCALVFEMIRSEKNLYNKNVLFPTGDLSVDQVLGLQRLSVEDKVEIHKWAYYLLRRVEIQGDSYLSWLQIKNRNSIDFIKQLGDVQSISREESLFKSFLISSKHSQERRIEYRGSSRGFYNLINLAKVSM